MNQKFKVYIISLLFLLLGAMPVSAKGLYEGCIFGFQFNEFESFKGVEVPATTGNCGKVCVTECRSMFIAQSTLDSGNVSDDATDQQIVFNPDVYYQCLTDCRSGKSGEKYFPRFIANDDPTNPIYEYRGPVSIGYTCPSDEQFPADQLNSAARRKFINDPRNNINSGFTVGNGDEVSITFIDSSKNQVHLCGTQGFSIAPTIRDIKHSEWDRTSRQNQIPKKANHICTFTDHFAGDSESISKLSTNFTNLNNKDLWLYTNSVSSPTEAPNTSMADMLNLWDGTDKTNKAQTLNAIDTIINNEIYTNAPTNDVIPIFNLNVQEVILLAKTAIQAAPSAGFPTYNNAIIAMREAMRFLDTYYQSNPLPDIITPVPPEVKAIEEKMVSSLCSWNVRNRVYTHTGIFAKDGDDVVLYWSGNMSIAKHSNGKAMDKNFLFSALKGSAISSAERSRYERHYNILGSLQIKKPGDKMDEFNSLTLEGEKARLDGFDSIGKYAPCFQEDGNPYKKLGLVGCVTDREIQYTTKQHDGRCITKELAQNDFEYCKTPITPGDPLYIFTGELSGFSSSESEIAVRHPEGTTSDNPLDNSGGLEVNIVRKGCGYAEGDRLEYAIFDANRDVINKGESDEYVEVTWKSTSKEMLFGTDPIKADKSGILHFRVKPLQAPSLDASDPENAKVMLSYGQGGLDGSYKFSLFKMQDSGFVNTNGPLRKIVKTVVETLFGTDTRRGAVQAIYEEAIKNSEFIQIIRALLVMYFAFIGLGFILGVIEMDQAKLMVRIIKIAVVLALISETSWEFFSSGFFNIFIYGGIELISYVATGGLGEILPFDPEEMQRDPSIIFAVFDGLIVQVFSANVWIKVGTYAISGIAGLFTAIIVTIALLTYVLTILKAFLMYLMALIMTATLLVVAPLFMPLMLFEFTKQFFDSWWKMLLSFTIQPVAIFAAIGIFNILIAIAIYATLSHTVCPICYFQITIPTVGDVCILPWYQLLFATHLPEGVTAIDLPGSMITSAIVLMLLTGAMWTFVEYIAKVVTMIIDINAYQWGASLGSGHSGHGFASDAANVGKGSVKSAGSAVGSVGRNTGRMSGQFAKGATGSAKASFKATGKAGTAMKKGGGAVVNKMKGH